MLPACKPLRAHSSERTLLIGAWRPAERHPPPCGRYDTMEHRSKAVGRLGKRDKQAAPLPQARF